jgi:hypothetical protein
MANEKIKKLGTQTADAVRSATDVLESELATGLAAAQKAQRRFGAERRVEAADLEAALTRFREDGHAVVDLARNLTAELRSESTTALTQRLFADADSALDLALGLVELAPDLLNQLLKTAKLDKPAEPRPRPTGSGGPEREQPAKPRRGGGR